MKILRVFPRQTNATPTDDLVYVNRPPDMFVPECDEIHISVAFTYDMARAEELAIAWEAVGMPVRIGGPAIGEPSGEFISGLYLKQGNTITSRGCNNKCWFCSVWQREPELKELAIQDGWNICDDNILSCSDQHIKRVFEMLGRQKEKAMFSGGLEAKLLKEWHVEGFRKLNPRRMYFAYDTPDDLEPLILAGNLLSKAGYNIKDRVCCCYVLIGYPKDTIEKATKRLHQTIDAGFFPFAMLYKNEQGSEKKEWLKFQRTWCNFYITATQIKEYKGVER